MNDASPPLTEPSDASGGPLLRSRRLRQAIRFALPQRNAIGSIIFLTLLSSAVNAIEPLILKALFDELAAGQRVQSLFLSLALLAVLALGRELLDGIANWLTWRTRIGLQYSLLESTVGKLHSMPLRIQRSEGVGA